METIDIQNSNNLQLDQTALGHLKETRQWTSFLSIVGFVFIGILAVCAFAIPSLAGLWGSTPLGGVGSVFFYLIMILFLALYFFPVYYLYSFSRYSKLAINNNDQLAFNEAMRFLKIHYRFIGILTIIVIGFYVLAIIIGAMAGSLINLFK